MNHSVAKEYKALIDKKCLLESTVRSLPIGYISEKIIKGKVQYYLQHRNGGKVSGVYIKASEVESVRQGIEARKSNVIAIQEIDDRIAKLEEAAKIIGNDLYCKLMVYKLSGGMDVLEIAEKERCTSFGLTMNAIEGVAMSEVTAAKVDEWKKGNKTYLSVFEETLRHYGFPTEVRG